MAAKVDGRWGRWCALALAFAACGATTSYAQDGDGSDPPRAEDGSAIRPAGEGDPGAGGEPAKQLTVNDLVPDSARRQQPISLRECVALALRANLEIRVEAFNPPIAFQDIVFAKAAFDPTLFANVNGSLRRTDTTPSSDSDLLSGVGRPRSDYTETTTIGYDAGLRKRSITGGTIELRWSQERSRDDPQRLDSRDPRYNSAVTLELTQPLLRGAGPEFNALDILIAESTRDSTLYQLQRVVIDVASRVELRYYDWMLTRENLVSAMESLRNAIELYDTTKAEVNAGAKNETDLLEAEKNVASRREQIVISKSAVTDAEDALKNVIDPSNTPLRDDVELIPTESLDVAPLAAIDLNVTLSRARALRYRPELLAARTDLGVRHLQVLRARNGLLPILDITSSVSFEGTAASHHDSVNDTGEFRYGSWGGGLRLEIPLGNRQAKASYAKARLQYAQGAADIERQEADIAIEIRGAIRSIETARQRLLEAAESERISREVYRRKDELRRSGSDKVTLFILNQFLTDLTQAQVSHNRAKIDYFQAFTRLRQSEASTIARLERMGILVSGDPTKALPNEPHDD